MKAISRVGGVLLFIALNIIAETAFTATPMHSPSYWVGHQQDELIASWGNPEATETIDAQRTSLTYTRSHFKSHSIDINYNGNSWGISDEPSPETLTIIVNESGIIVDFEWSQSENSRKINWYAIGHTVIVVGLIAVFVYVMHFMPNPDGDWVG